MSIHATPIQHGTEARFQADIDHDGTLDQVKLVHYEDKNGHHFSALVERYGNGSQPGNAAIATDTRPGQALGEGPVLTFSGALETDDLTPGFFEVSFDNSVDGGFEVQYTDRVLVPSGKVNGQWRESDGFKLANPQAVDLR